jgi:hypothetical protein
MTNLQIQPGSIRLEVGQQSYEFTQDATNTWVFAGVSVNGVKTAVPLSAQDSFFVGGGRASSYTVRANSTQVREITFALGTNAVTYKVDASDMLPMVHVAIAGPASTTVAYRTVAADPEQHGAWVTRGETASDAENKEVFIDGSGPMVFGHSKAGNVDAAYVILAKVGKHIQHNGRTQQKSNTYFKSGRTDTGQGRAFSFWQLRMGPGEPTQYGLLFDRDLGGRFSNVCEKYYAGVVDSLVNLADIAMDYDPDKALQKMPLRLSAPDAFIPGYGWTMEEYTQHAYPYAHDSSIQTGNFLAFEGLATGRDWEKNFGKFILDKTPLVGKDGTSFFVYRPGGITRWGYNSDYQRPFPRVDGGGFGDTQALYTTAQMTGDAKLKAIALQMMQHDVNVKLDLEKMLFAPCWNVETGAPGDTRDNWAITTLLAYAAELCSQNLTPETHDPAYLQKADRICAWFKSILDPETRMNYLNDGVNMYNCWAGWIPVALIHKYERSGDRTYLDIAKDVSWVQILTLGVTADKDPQGRAFTGVTCVGVRGCVDYDCAPNLCQEKDQVFVNVIGPLLDHASGPAYAKYLQLQKIALPRDCWNDAFGVQELRDINLRTMYDTYMRGMANLTYALNKSTDPKVAAVEKLVSKRDLAIGHQRDTVLANGTQEDRTTTLHVRYLQPGTYRLFIEGADQGKRTDSELSAGFPVRVPANATRSVKVALLSLTTVAPPPSGYDGSVTYLSNLVEVDSQRGVGLPAPTFVKDKSFDGGALSVQGKSYQKGLGCAANTAIVYDLDRQYQRFQAVAGLNAAILSATDPAPSVNFTVFVDGICKFDSGPITASAPAKPIDVDVRNAKTLVLRISDNWDSDGRSDHDRGNWADARLSGKALRTTVSTHP